MMTSKAKTSSGSTALRPALVVAGMHRSGTSAMARVLSLAGGSLPERVINPGPDNPLGFWEPWEMVALSDEILDQVGSAWDDIFVHRADARAWDRRDTFLARAETFIAQNYADRPLPVIKDPRSSVLTRLWRQALQNQGLDPVYVIMVRNPLDVAGSLRARDGFPIEKGLLLWAAYMVATERDTRGHRRLFVSYDALLDDWRAVLDGVDRAVGAPMPDRAAGSTEIDRFLSRSHRHHQADLADVGTLKGTIVGAVHDWMQAATTDTAPDPAEIQAAGQDMERLAKLLAPILEDERRRSDIRIATSANAIADCEAKLLRQGARVGEIVRAESLLREQLADTLTAKTARAEELEQALRTLRLETTELKTTISRLLDDQRATNQEASTRISELNDALTQQRHESEQRTRALKASISWKVTRPIRVLQHRLKRRPAP